MTLRIGISGITGRVGHLVRQEILESPEKFKLSAGLARTPVELDVPVYGPEDLKDFCKSSDCIVDFSTPDSLKILSKLAAETGTPIVSGTTGLSDKEYESLKSAAKKIPIVHASNMSLGINLLQSIIEQTARVLESNQWDIEITETHHKHKKDAPSGTALTLGESAAKGRDTLLENAGSYERKGRDQERKTGEIGFSVRRGGDIVGEHDVYFYGPGEYIKLGHCATDRSLFAKGALHAAQWVIHQPPGLYSMKDVLSV